MADKAHNLTDEKLAKMEKHLSAIYKKASKEIGKDWKEYLKKSNAEIDRLTKEANKVNNDPNSTARQRFEARKRVEKAKQNQTIRNRRFKELTDRTAAELSNVNKTAMAYINDQLPEVYTLNYNSTEGLVKGYSFSLVDQNTVKNLSTKNETLLPYKYVDGKKDVRWNSKKLNAEVLQGILQGESMDKIANRFSKVVEMDKVSSIRNARTTVTSAENKGRLDSYYRLQDEGISIKKQWMSTLDMRTRHSHALLDGQTVEIDKPFKSELGDIMFPADPEADPANVYNCRCTLIGDVGQKKSASRMARDADGKSVLVQNMSYTDWYNWHTGKPFKAAKVKIENKFIYAKTIKEANEYAKKFAKDVYYKSNNLEAVNKANETLEHLTSEYPINQMQKLGTNGRLKNANAHANYSLIEINKKYLDENGSVSQSWADRIKENEKLIEKYKTEYLGNPLYDQKRVKQAIKQMEREKQFNRWSVSGGKVERTITHEYGHVIADQYFGQINGRYANSNFGYGASNRCNQQIMKVKDVYKKAQQNGDIYNISMYADTNEHEFFAETFAMYDLGEKLPDYIEEMIKEVLKNGIL